MDDQRRPNRVPTDGDSASTSPTDSDQEANDHSPGSNGLRVHGIYFAIVSIAALVLLVGLIAIASAAMN